MAEKWRQAIGKIRKGPTLEEIRSWGKSFDKLMRSPSGRKAFREFLRCEYSEENILFWLACEELKKETNPEAIEEKARFIYEDYISILSPKEVGFINSPQFKTLAQIPEGVSASGSTAESPSN
uniref:RGS domain-containing protein n=1 Tax=Anopheles atroparvus TaxID=41427 RepID=A0A182J1E1_ANOAO